MYETLKIYQNNNLGVFTYTRIHTFQWRTCFQSSVFTYSYSTPFIYNACINFTLCTRQNTQRYSTDIAKTQIKFLQRYSLNYSFSQHWYEEDTQIMLTEIIYFWVKFYELKIILMHLYHPSQGKLHVLVSEVKQTHVVIQTICEEIWENSVTQCSFIKLHKCLFLCLCHSCWRQYVFGLSVHLSVHAWLCLSEISLELYFQNVWIDFFQIWWKGKH